MGGYLSNTDDILENVESDELPIVEVVVKRLISAGLRFREIKGTTDSNNPNPDMTEHANPVHRYSAILHDDDEIVFFVKNFIGHKHSLRIDAEFSSNSVLQKIGLSNNTWEIYSQKNDPFLLTKNIDGLVSLRTLQLDIKKDQDLIEGLIKLLAKIHCQGNLIHGDLQPKNIGFVPSEFIQANQSGKDIGGIYIIDFEHAEVINDQLELEEGIYKDLRTFFAYQDMNLDEASKRILAEFIVDEYKKYKVSLDQDSIKFLLR